MEPHMQFHMGSIWGSMWADRRGRNWARKPNRNCNICKWPARAASGLSSHTRIACSWVQVVERRTRASKERVVMVTEDAMLRVISAWTATVPMAVAAGDEKDEGFPLCVFAPAGGRAARRLAGERPAGGLRTAAMRGGWRPGGRWLANGGGWKCLMHQFDSLCNIVFVCLCCCGNLPSRDPGG